jgi:hypothetical protein
MPGWRTVLKDPCEVGYKFYSLRTAKDCFCRAIDHSFQVQPICA